VGRPWREVAEGWPVLGQVLTATVRSPLTDLAEMEDGVTTTGDSIGVLEPMIR
jgi:hypothetical protein